MVANIQSKWLDVEGGYKGIVEALPRSDRLGSSFPVYENEMPIIPRDQWRDMIESYDYSKVRKRVGRVKYQTMGSCASHASTSIAEILRNKVVGVQNYIELSPLSVYKHVGRSPNSGSTLDANMRQISQVGILPADTAANKDRFAHTWPENDWRNPLPSGWQETAKLFRYKEWFDISSFDGMMSALLMMIPVYYGRAGHAITGMYPVYKDGGFFVCYLNSWDESWGDDGYGFDSERFVSGSIRSYGCFAPRLGTILEDDQLELAV